MALSKFFSLLIWNDFRLKTSKTTVIELEVPDAVLEVNIISIFPPEFQIPISS